MSELPTRNPFYRAFWRFDSRVSTAVFEAWDGLKRGWSAYASFLEHFRVRGPWRLIIDVLDDMGTLGTAFTPGRSSYSDVVVPDPPHTSALLPGQGTAHSAGSTATEPGCSVLPHTVDWPSDA